MFLEEAKGLTYARDRQKSDSAIGVLVCLMVYSDRKPRNWQWRWRPDSRNSGDQSVLDGMWSLIARGLRLRLVMHEREKFSLASSQCLSWNYWCYDFSIFPFWLYDTWASKAAQELLGLNIPALLLTEIALKMSILWMPIGRRAVNIPLQKGVAPQKNWTLTDVNTIETPIRLSVAHVLTLIHINAGGF